MYRANLKETISQIQEEKVIQDWVEGLRPATIENYIKSIALLTQLTNKNPTELLEIAWKEQEERVPPWQQSIEEWYRQLTEYNNKTDASKTSANSRKTNISAFFHFYRIVTPQNYTKRKKNNPLTVKNEREGLTKQDIRDALNATKTFKMKALILTQATSGLALQDVLQLNIEQFNDGLITIDDDYQICKIHHRRTKSTREHYTFIGFEAVNLIKKYIKLERKGDMEGPLFTSRSNFNERYKHKSYAVQISRLNKQLKWDRGHYEYGKLTTHMLRKFFETQLTNAGIINDHLVHMMGWKHKDPLKATYYLANSEELQKSYIKHLKYLTLENVETITIESSEVRDLKKSFEEKLTERDKQTKPLLWIAEVLKADPELTEQFKKAASKHNIN